MSGTPEKNDYNSLITNFSLPRSRSRSRSPSRRKSVKKEAVKGDRPKQKYLDMIVEAIEHHHTRGNRGCGIQTIYNYIYTTYDVPENYQIYTKRAFVQGVEDEVLEREKNSYFISSAYKKKLNREKGKALKKKKRRSSSSSSSSTSSSLSKSVSERGRKKRRKTKISSRTRSKSPLSTRRREKKYSLDSHSRSPVKRKKGDKKRKRSVSPLKRTSTPIKKRRVMTKPTMRRQPSMTIMRSEKLRSKKAKTNLEIIFSFDTTGSMMEYLDNVRAKITEIATQLLDDVAGIRIGIIAHGDYEQSKKEPYVIKTMDFSENVRDIAQFVNNVEPTYGADWPECYELALQTARTSFSWTENYYKSLVMIGDAVPHKPDEFDKIDWREELQKLVEMHVKVYSVQCNTYKEEVTAFFGELAEESGGERFNLDNVDKIKDVFMALCYREAAEANFQQHSEQIQENISKLKRTDSAQLLLPKEMEKTTLTEQEILTIHNHIHDTTKDSVKIKGTTYNISSGVEGTRTCQVNELTFVEQNKKSDTRYGRLALEGSAITWITRKGRWGLIVDRDIKVK